MTEKGCLQEWQSNKRRNSGKVRGLRKEGRKKEGKKKLKIDEKERVSEKQRIIPCKYVARQRPQNKQLRNGHY
jgi:hypothetical protein